jgi:serine/threonine-protein kinase HipA
MRKAEIKFHDRIAGWLTQDENGYHFVYDPAFLKHNDAAPVSRTMLLQNGAYHSNVLFPFFDGLIPEGWLLQVAEKNWKLNPRDRMGLLLSCCKDCIGAVSVVAVNEEANEK